MRCSGGIASLLQATRLVAAVAGSFVAWANRRWDIWTGGNGGNRDWIDPLFSPLSPVGFVAREVSRRRGFLFVCFASFAVTFPMQGQAGRRRA